MTLNTPPNGIDTVILEKDSPFSKSILWDLQRAAYTQFGMQAWTNKGVPFYLTSNPHTAHLYTEVAIGYIQDCLKENARTPIDFESPLYIFDLGAGSGRFAFLFLKHLLNALDVSGLNALSICYVITDVVTSNLDFCSSHPQMQPFIHQGMLDFAFFDHSQKDRNLRLRFKNQELTCHNLKNPAIIIANYFFDTIPQDLFKFQQGTLYEGCITLKVPKGMIDLSKEGIDPAWINGLSASYSYFPFDASAYFQNSQCNSVMDVYQKQFDGLPFLFPTGACQAIDYFASITNNRLLLLAGDQGVCSEEQVKEWGEPKLSLHGSFSVAVSYHALQCYFKCLGGEALLTEQSDPLFVVMAAILGGKGNDFRSMRYAFKNSMDAFEPSDYWKIVNAVENECIHPSLEHLLTLLKLGYWDPVNFNAFFKAIRSQISSASSQNKKQLARAIAFVWENFYAVSSDEAAFIMNLGVLLFEMRHFKDALHFFERALELGGSNPQLNQNIAACHQKLI